MWVCVISYVCRDKNRTRILYVSKVWTIVMLVMCVPVCVHVCERNDDLIISFSNQFLDYNYTKMHKPKVSEPLS